MKFSLLGIYDRGVLDKERIHIKASAAIDLQFCIILDTNYINDNSVLAGQRTCFWFASKPIKAGENIVLYSRGGTATTENRPDGTVFHFFFRGNSKTIYDDPKSTVSVFEISSWIAHPVKFETKPSVPVSTPGIFDYLKQ